MSEARSERNEASRFRIYCIAIIMVVGSMGAEANAQETRFSLETRFGKTLEDLMPAAKAGDAHAQYQLACTYDILAVFHPEDLKPAIEWYTRAAEQGSVAAQRRLAELFHAGRGVPKDEARSVEWDQRATDQLLTSARQGDAGAQTALGEAYMNGSGVQKSDEVALTWLRMAARQGSAKALDMLALLHCRGRGVPKKLDSLLCFAASRSKNRCSLLRECTSYG